MPKVFRVSTLSLMAVVLLASVSLSLPGFAGSLKSRPRIDGGKLDSANRFASTVLLKIENADDDYWNCSGTLIAPQILLTAAHCLLHVVDSDATVGVNGPNQPDDEEGMTRGKHFIMGSNQLEHLKSSSSKDSDLKILPDEFALIVLDRPEKLKSYPSLACAQPSSGMPVSIAGYGIVNRVTATISGGKPSFSIEETNKIMYPSRYFGSNQLACKPDRSPNDFITIVNTLSGIASSKQQGTNHGDSGSGLLSPLGTMIYGVTSGVEIGEGFDAQILQNQPYKNYFASVSSSTAMSILSYAKRNYPNEMKNVKLCPDAGNLKEKVTDVEMTLKADPEG